MAMNGFLNSDITSSNKEGGSATSCRVQIPSPSDISSASLRVTHRTTLPESARVTTRPRRMKHSPTNLVRAEITGGKNSY